MAAIPIPITGLAGRKSLGIGVLCGLAVALIWLKRGAIFAP